MQLADLVKPIEQMTDEELLERLRRVRHNREVVRPATKARVERAAKKVGRAKVTKTENLLEALTEAERAELIRQLSGA